jgi:hypothetical protein
MVQNVVNIFWVQIDLQQKSPAISTKITNKDNKNHMLGIKNFNIFICNKNHQLSPLIHKDQWRTRHRRPRHRLLSSGHACVCMHGWLVGPQVSWKLCIHPSIADVLCFLVDSWPRFFFSSEISEISPETGFLGPLRKKLIPF